MHFFSLEQLANLIWGPGMLALILGTGIYFTIGTRGLPVTKLGLAFRLVLQKPKNAEGDVSGFSALCTSLAATLGTGNIIGVATAIAAGGPGALFWMQLSAVFGMATKYAECFLAVRYRTRGKDQTFLGGPFFYLEKGLHKPWLARVFAASCVLACLISMGTTSQINGIVAAAEEFFDPMRQTTVLNWSGGSVTLPVMCAAILTTLIVGLVLSGGIHRIAKVATVLVPFMGGLYTFLVLWLLFLYAPALPQAAMLILKSAFAPTAALGAMTGITLQKAMRYGLGRGVFTNESGMGSDPIAAATAETDSPVRQGLIAILGPFIDTIFMCSLTGFAVLVTGVWQDIGLPGSKVTLYALKNLPIPASFLSFIYMLCLVFFSFSAIIGWSFFGEQSLRYLFPHWKNRSRWFHALFLLLLFFGSFLSTDMVWSLADIFCGLMAIPNLIGLLGLSGQVFQETRRFFAGTSFKKQKKL